MSMLWRATWVRWVIVKSSDKTWSTAGGNCKPLQYSCLENPMDQPISFHPTFNFMSAVSNHSDFGAKKRRSVIVPSFFPSTCHEVIGFDAMILVFWTLCFKSSFSLFSFTHIKRLFSSFSLSAIRFVSSAYLRLLIFLLAISIPAFDSSNLAFHMMHSA